MTIKTDGLDELARMLAELGNKAQGVASGALFDGAAVVADAMSNAIGSIQTEPFHYAPEGQTRLPSPQEKAALVGKIGVAKFRKSGGEVDTRIGFTGSGYAKMAGQVKPVAVIARSINRGTSFMKKQPVFRRAVSQSKSAAQAAITAKAEEMFNEIIGK